MILYCQQFFWMFRSAYVSIHGQLSLTLLPATVVCTTSPLLKTWTLTSFIFLPDHWLFCLHGGTTGGWSMLWSMFKPDCDVMSNGRAFLPSEQSRYCIWSDVGKIFSICAIFCHRSGHRIVKYMNSNLWLPACTLRISNWYLKRSSVATMGESSYVCCYLFNLPSSKSSCHSCQVPLLKSLQFWLLLLCNLMWHLT